MARPTICSAQMEHGMTYDAALAEAQRLGYAETDPTGDVEGFDAAAKAAIIATMLMGGNLRPEDVQRVGITKIDARGYCERSGGKRALEADRAHHQHAHWHQRQRRANPRANNTRARQCRRGNQRANLHHRPAWRCHTDRPRRRRRCHRLCTAGRYYGALG